ncbi:MAG: hypothetical protein Q9227_007442 [Pyrenula ochraceoflavens]
MRLPFQRQHEPVAPSEPSAGNDAQDPEKKDTEGPAPQPESTEQNLTAKEINKEVNVNQDKSNRDSRTDDSETDVIADEKVPTQKSPTASVKDAAPPKGTRNSYEKETGKAEADELPDKETSPAERTDSKDLAPTTTHDTQASESAVDDESKYPHGFPLWFLTFGLCVSTFVVALDNTIIATAIPKITTVFDSLNDVGWYGSAYLLTTTSLQPSFGKVYTYFNVKWTYIIALILFEAGSVLCAAATTSKMLIGGRALAGVGASALFSGSMTIIGYTVTLRKRAIYIALLSSMFGIASVVGPILGGAFTDKLTWRWCFWINLPVGGIAIAAVFFFFKNPDRKESKLTFKEKIGQIDILGAGLLICAIVCLLLALQWGGSVYPWSNSKVWGCLLGFGLILIAFLVVQIKRRETATIPYNILLQRTVGACALFSAFLAMAIYTQIYYLPFYFQAVKGTTAEGSGIRTIPFLVSNTIASVVVGGSITAIGPYVPFLYLGSTIYVVGSGLLYTLTVSSSAGRWIGYQILAGAGSGACIQIPFIAVQVVLSKKDMPSGNAIAVFFNTLGGAISVSIAQNIFTNSLVKNIPKYAPGANAAKIIAAGATHVREVTPPRLLAGVLLAYDKAVTRTFILPIAVGGLAFLTCALFEWKTVKGRNLMAGGA